MSFYNKRFEDERKRKMTPERIVEIARRSGSFEVSLRYRDDWLRKRCITLRKQRHLCGGRKIIRGSLVFYPRKQGESHDQAPRIQGCRDPQ